MTAKNKTTPWIRLGDYIEECDERNLEGLPLPFYGINKEKTFMPTVADTNQLDNSKYKVVGQGVFVFSGMQTGRDQCIRLALREDKNPVLISPAYTTFRMKDESKLLPEYLFIFFKRKEMDRYGAFLSDGSIRSNLDWDRFCDICIPLPSLEVQQELVDTYTGLQRLAKENEALIAPLTEACQAFIVDCQKKYPSVELGKYIEECDERNTEGRNYSFLGINKAKTFMPTHANTNELDNTKYKIVSRGIFAFSGTQTGRDICIRIALYDKNKPALVSPAYTTFRIKSPKLLSEYLFLQFKRSEMDRHGWYLSDSSVRSNLEWERFNKIQVPLPPLEVQQSIVNLYHCIEEAKKIASEARAQLQTLCPALIQYAEHN